jgi:hypothetical protein
VQLILIHKIFKVKLYQQQQIKPNSNYTSNTDQAATSYKNCRNIPKTKAVHIKCPRVQELPFTVSANLIPPKKPITH